MNIISIDNFEFKNISGNNEVREDFENLNLNDDGLYTVLLEHIKGQADKHKISHIENDSEVSGNTVKDTLQFIYNTFLKHKDGEADKHSTSHIINDSDVDGESAREVLEFIYNTFLKHTKGETNIHNTSHIKNDSELIANTLNEALQLLKNEIDLHKSSVSSHEAETIIFNNENIAEITANDVQNAILQLNSRVSNIITMGGDGNPEIVDGRNSIFWGIVFSSLKERLDYTESKLGEIYPQKELDVVINHNMNKYPIVELLSGIGAYGVGGYGELPYGGSDVQTENIKVLHNDKNSFKIVVPKGLDLGTAIVNEVVEQEEYAVVFDSDTNISLTVILR